MRLKALPLPVLSSDTGFCAPGNETHEQGAHSVAAMGLG